MKRRKLVQHGEKTLMISLPAKWVKAQGLKKGDEIVITPKDDILTVSKGELMARVQEIELDIQPETSKHARFAVGNAYKLGYDKIHVNFKGQEQLKFVKEQLRQMIGFEITSLSKNSCVLQSVIKSTPEEYESIKKRVWHNIKSAFEILISDMKTNEYPNDDMIMELYFNILKYTDFCRRLINKHRFLDLRESCLEYACLLKLLYIAPLLRDIYNNLKKDRIKPSRLFISYVEDISDQFDKVYTSYYTKDINLAFKIVSARKAILKKRETLYKNPRYALIVGKLVEIEKHCFGFTGHINALFFLSNK